MVFALVLEQLRPMDGRRVDGALHRLGAWSTVVRPPGCARSPVCAWLFGVALALAAAMGAWWLLRAIHPVLGFAFNVAVLYAVIAYRRESRFFADIVVALSTGNLERARSLIGDWRGRDHGRAGAAEVARLGIEQALVTGHRSFFGPLLWFVLLPGPAGAVLYRVALHLAREEEARQVEGGGVEDEAAARTMETGAASVRRSFARDAFALIDWVPVRMTALAFSVIGNFEDAIYCWRSQSMLWPDRASGILIAAGAGALGVRLGLPMHEGDAVVDRPEMGVGARADVAHMESAANLLWRVLVLVLLVLTLLGIAGWVGR